jgi:hypothetical protein
MSIMFVISSWRCCTRDACLASHLHGQYPLWDLAGAELLAWLHATLGAQGMEFRLAETRGPVREALRRLGSAHATVLVEANQTVDDALNGWRAMTHLPA